LVSIAVSADATLADGFPAQIVHQLRDSAAGLRTSHPLRDFQVIEHRMRGDALDAVSPNSPPQPRQSWTPRVGF